MIKRTTVVATAFLMLAGCTAKVPAPTAEELRPIVNDILSRGKTLNSGVVTPFQSVLQIRDVTVAEASVEGKIAKVVVRADVENTTMDYIVNVDQLGKDRMWDRNKTIRLEWTLRLKKYDTGWRVE